MSKTTLLLFWAMWLLDVLAALYGYREFIFGIFGQHATPTRKYVTLWLGLLGAATFLIIGSLYFKNQGQTTLALSLLAVPLVLALPYLLFMLIILLSGKNTRWN